MQYLQYVQTHNSILILLGGPALSFYIIDRSDPRTHFATGLAEKENVGPPQGW